MRTTVTGDLGFSVIYLSVDESGVREHQDFVSRVDVPGYGETAASSTYTPAAHLSPPNPEAHQVYLSSGTVELAYASVGTFNLDYRSTMEIGDFETISDYKGTHSWPALRVFRSMNAYGIVNGLRVSVSDSVYYWLVDGVGIVRYVAANSSGTMETWKLMSAQVAPIPHPSGIKNFQGLWWNSSEPGWGINFAHQGDIIFATWFTYDSQGKPWWLIAQLEKLSDAAGTYSGPVWTVAGPPFNAMPWEANRIAYTVVGTMAVTFADLGHGTLEYTVNGSSQSKEIVPQQFGPLPTCSWGFQTSLMLAKNFTDLWWNSSEPGWGINFAHQGDIIFATWFTYDNQGKPWWLIAQLERIKSYSAWYKGTVWTVKGPPFDLSPFEPSKVVHTPVGSSEVDFGDGNSAWFVYDVDGVRRQSLLQRQVYRAPGTACQ